jgi:hypothetical protein
MNIARYRNASHVIPHLVLTDLDSYECPAGLMADWGAATHFPRLIFRVAVREVESWVIADRQGVASWMQVSLNRLPLYPEELADPKAMMLALGRRSRSRRFRQEFCPAPGSSASQGPLYNERLCQFIRDGWDIAAARRAAPSLDRACARILECVEDGGR